MNGLDCDPTCPFTVGRAPTLDFPVGQIHRVSMRSSSSSDEGVDETKRNLLKLLAIAGVIGAGAGGVVGGALQYVQPPTVGLGSYPKTQLLDLDGSALTVDTALREYNWKTSELHLFNYALQNEPNFFLCLEGAPFKPLGGIGGPNQTSDPNSSQGPIVAFSAICQHLGCPAPAISYYPPGTCPKFSPSGVNGPMSFYIHCSCHGSTYDVTANAAVLTGPTLYALPQIILETDADGNIYAVNMASLNGQPVNGHLSNLTGGYGVGSSQQLTKDTPTILCP